MKLSDDRILEIWDRVSDAVPILSRHNRVHIFARAIEAEVRVGAEPINQCDGCQRGLPVNENGIHRDEQMFGMMCTKDRYTTAPVEPVSGQRALIAELRDWFESQAKTISKGCGSPFELMQVRALRDKCEVALTTPPASEVQTNDE